MSKQKEVLVIGAGASGMMAAVTAAKSGCKVTIIERSSKIGRKIEVTGNGKCNYTNAFQDISCYHTDKPAYVKQILEQFSVSETLEFFRRLGIVPVCKNGYYYPYSGQAGSVAAALRMEAERLKVKFACNITIADIRKKDRFHVITDGGYVYEGDAVVLAAGSCAAPATGSDGSGYILAEKLGHFTKKPLPALAPLLCNSHITSILAGLRTPGRVSLVIDKKMTGSETGEIQFVKKGISGIPVFQLSGGAARALDEKKKVSLSVNYLAGIGMENLHQFLEERRCNLSDRSVKHFFNGLLHEKVIRAVSEKTGIDSDKKAGVLSSAEWEYLKNAVLEMKFDITGTGDFQQAQVCSGGITLDQLAENTLESKNMKGLYFAGEILDVDGICGGYNLQWAWSSGYVAGKHASKNENR